MYAERRERQGGEGNGPPSPHADNLAIARLQVILVRSPLDQCLGHEELESTAPPSAYESCTSASAESSLEEARDCRSVLKQGALEVRVLGRGLAETSADLASGPAAGAARPGRSDGTRRGKPLSCPGTPPPSPRSEIGTAAKVDTAAPRSSPRVLSQYELPSGSTGSKARSLVDYAAPKEEEEDISTDDPDDEDLCFFA